MAKFYGNVGYGIEEERPLGSGVYVFTTVSRPYYGDIIKNTRKWESGEGLNDDLKINNTFSIVADEFAYAHMYAMKYVEYLGIKWKITSVDIERPRLILTIGGEYHEQPNRTPTEVRVNSGS